MEVTTPPRRGRAEKLDCQNKLNNNLFKSPERGEREAMLKVKPRNTRHNHQLEPPLISPGRLQAVQLRAEGSLHTPQRADGPAWFKPGPADWQGPFGRFPPSSWPADRSPPKGEQILIQICSTYNPTLYITYRIPLKFKWDGGWALKFKI